MGQVGPLKIFAKHPTPAESVTVKAIGPSVPRVPLMFPIKSTVHICAPQYPGRAPGPIALAVAVGERERAVAFGESEAVTA